MRGIDGGGRMGEDMTTPEDADDNELRARCVAWLDGINALPPPELYDECIAAGTWPLTVSREQAAAYWQTRRARGIP